MIGRVAMNDFILNLVFIMIPETMFMVLMSFILLKRFDLIDIYKLKYTIKNIAIPTIITSAFYCALCLFIDEGIVKFISMGILLVLLTYVFNNTSNEVFSIKIILKVVLTFFIVFFIMFILETICILFIFVLYQTPNKVIENLQSDINIKLLISIPAFILEVFTIFIFYVKKEIKFVLWITRMHQVIIKNKRLLYIGISLMFSLVVVGLLIINMIFIDNIFENVDVIKQIIIIIFMFFISPLLSILFYLNSILFVIKFENQIQQTYGNCQ
jgi:hypothetical protein